MTNPSTTHAPASWVTHLDPTRFDKGRTLRTDERYGLTDDYQDRGEKTQLPNPAGPVDNGEFSLGDLLAEFVLSPAAMMPVLNREPRSHISSRVRRAIARRDGGWVCWICGELGRVVDHVVPRSAFADSELHLADRTDNLRLACSGCNGSKSNKLYNGEPPLGIVLWCGEDQWGEDGWPDVARKLVFCDMCGMTRPVPTSWSVL